MKIINIVTALTLAPIPVLLIAFIWTEGEIVFLKLILTFLVLFYVMGILQMWIILNE